MVRRVYRRKCPIARSMLPYSRPCAGTIRGHGRRPALAWGPAMLDSAVTSSPTCSRTFNETTVSRRNARSSSSTGSQMSWTRAWTWSYPANCSGRSPTEPGDQFDAGRFDVRGDHQVPVEQVVDQVAVAGARGHGRRPAPAWAPQVGPDLVVQPGVQPVDDQPAAPDFL
jgi:hypothetical protein